MKTIFQFPLSSHVSVRLLGKEIRKTPPRFRKEIDAIWENEKKEEFFDGAVLSVVRYNPEVIDCELVSYKAFYASIKRKSLCKYLNIFPLGISGRTLCDSRVLIGTRSQHVTMYPGEKECVPSGSLDKLFLRQDGTLDIVRGVLTELCEESSVQPDVVEGLVPRSLYCDMENGVFDIHVDISLKKDASLEQVTSPSGEYADLFWVDRANITTQLLEECLPLSRILLQS